MKSLLLALSLPLAFTACMEDEHGRDRDRGHSDHHGATLPNDAYYVGVPLPFISIDDCVASGKLAGACTNTVALCASGAYGVRHGDDVATGRYDLDDHHAVAGGKCHGHDHDDGDYDASGEKVAPFDFDVEAGELVGDIGIAWEPDYDGLWKTAAASAVDCSARPPRR